MACLAVLVLLLLAASPVCPRKPTTTSAFSDTRARNEVSTGDVHPSCDYGTLPCTWQESAIYGSQLLSLVSGCPLHNLLDAQLRDDGGLSPLGVLFLGDSVDLYTVQWLCEHAAHNYSRRVVLVNKHEAGHRDVYNYCEVQQAHLHVGHFHIPGVHPEGPYFEGAPHNATLRMASAQREWQQHSGGEGAPPHVVVVSANLWDVARLHAKELTGMVPDYGPLRHLPPSYLGGYMANLTMLIRQARSMFPQSLLLLHTSVPVRSSDKTGLTENTLFGRTGFIHQVNMAMRAVASTLDVPLIDYEAFAAGFSSREVLKDTIHPRPWFVLEMFNVMLNVLRRSRS